MINLPKNIEFPTQQSMDKLLQSQWKARIYFMSSPTRKAYNNKWRAKFKRRAKRLAALK